MLNRFRDRGLRAFTAVLLLSTQACYSFVPLTSGAALRVGEQARVRLTPEGTVELARYLGPNVVEAEGTVTAIAGDGGIILAVEMVEQSNGLRQPWAGEGVVAIPAMYRRDVERRVFQKRRSVVGGSFLALGLIGLAVIALRGGGGEGGVEIPPPPP